MTTKISGTGFDELVVDNLVLSNPLPEQYGGSGSTGVYKMGYATPKSATGTFVDFTGIPSWAKRVSIMLNGVSLNGASNHVIKLGTSGGIESTGYSGAFVGATAGGASAGTTETTGFLCGVGSSAGNAFYGTVVLTNLSNNLWSCAGGLCIATGSFSGTTAGAKSLSGTLDRIRITSFNGTDLFDAGTINVMWEGFA